MSTRVRDVMDPDPATVAPDTSIEDVLRVQRERAAGHPGRLVGVVTRGDVLGALAAG